MRLGTILAAALVAPMIVLAGAPAQATTTYTVSGFGDPSPTPACDGTVCPSLRAAVSAANQAPGSVIELGSGTFQLSQDKLDLTASVTISGAGAASTTIEQTGEFRIIDAHDSTSTSIEDLTLTGGQSVYRALPPDAVDASAILNFGTMTLDRVVVTGNRATGGSDPQVAAGSGGPGGAVFVSTIQSVGALTLIASTISDNVGQAGAGQAGDPAGNGGVSLATVRTSGPLAVIDSTFADNLIAAGDAGPVASVNGAGGPGGNALGGALLVEGSSATTIRGSTFVGNRVTGGAGSSSTGGAGGTGGGALGAAIYTDAADLEVVNSTFAHNVATAGAGGSGSSGGADGYAAGGAIFVQEGPGHPAKVSLASDTFADNSAVGSSAAAGGTLALDTGTVAAIRDTIIESGTSTGTHGSCDLAPSASVTDSGHNLEDSSPSQCGFSAASGDLIGQDADLGPLADNGGATETLLPKASSPVIGAGGTCTDPTVTPAAPLTVDQRGAPRPAGRPCDIGAVQLPVPLNTKLPTITPTSPPAGRTATCNPGTFLGADAVTYDYAWTRDGSPVGQDKATYPVPSADIGHALRCTVVAHGAGYSSPPASSAARTVVPPTPVLSNLQQTHTTWRIPSGRAGSVPMGTRFSFSLDEPASVTLVFTRVVSGRYLRTGKVVRSARAGSNTIGFTGRLDSGLELRPGHYIVTFSAKNNWNKVSRPANLHFALVS